MCEKPSNFRKSQADPFVLTSFHYSDSRSKEGLIKLTVIVNSVVQQKVSSFRSFINLCKKEFLFFFSFVQTTLGRKHSFTIIILILVYVKEDPIETFKSTHLKQSPIHPF